MERYPKVKYKNGTSLHELSEHIEIMKAEFEVKVVNIKGNEDGTLEMIYLISDKEN